MHRTTFLPRSLAWSLLLGCVLTALAPMASAQRPEQLPGLGQNLAGGAKEPKAAPEPVILILPKDSTRQVEMSSKELIAEVRSENPRVVKVQTLLENPRAVLLTGIGAGITRVYITDTKRNTESLEVRVPQDEEAEREARRRDLLEQIHKAVPTASVDVVPSAGNTVVVMGTVPHAESVQVIMELARAMFGGGGVGATGAINNVVNALRITGVQQVQIEVTIARVNRSKARNIGFSWLNGGLHHYLASTVGGSGALNNTGASTLPSVVFPVSALSASPNAVFGVFNDKQSFMGWLTALTTEGLAKLISEPRVTTLSGRPAWIVSGGETPLLTTSGTGSPTVTYKTFGTIVNFLPIVMGNGKIHMEVRPEISAINAAAGITIPTAVGTTSVPGFDLRSAQVTVEMEDGQTLAIGGLIQNTINAQNQKVPVLGDIPFLAFAFTSKTYTETEEELIILVTPHLIDPMACCQLPKYLPGRETRVPDDFELFLEGILEAPRGQRQLTHPYTGAYLNGPTAGTFPCGDASGRGNCGCAGTGCVNTGCATGACSTTASTPGHASPMAPATGANPSVVPPASLIPEAVPAPQTLPPGTPR